MNQIAWFLRLSLDGSFTSELNRKRQACSLWKKEILEQSVRGLVAMDSEEGMAKVAPILGAPSCVHFAYTLNCELNLGPGIEGCKYLMLISLICILTFRTIFVFLFLSFPW